ncbi:hypothetical protein DFJ74DRAFT_602631 [Hyaloraphidium curvatum]|nr:hypothetical protein DFJ74DRAFT_602631 [Hyaloraphidium curvatum]
MQRLLRELAALAADPVPGIRVDHTDDARRLRLTLTPASGPRAGSPLEFDVDIPEDYPSQAPRVAVGERTQRQGLLDGHPNVFGGFICCDVLTGTLTRQRIGYTPGYTLGAVFVQLLSFFTTRDVEQEYGGTTRWGPPTSEERRERRAARQREWEAMRREALEAQRGARASPRPRTPPPPLHSVVAATGPPEPQPVPGTTPMQVPVVGAAQTPAARGKTPAAKDTAKGKQAPAASKPRGPCHLDTLHEDLLLYLADRLPDSSLVALRSAYPRFDALARARNLQIRRELACFYLRTPLPRTFGDPRRMLGVGVDVAAADGRGDRVEASSEFDVLSFEAFDACGVRTGVFGHRFTHFLPLAFSRPHYDAALPAIRRSLVAIHDRCFPSALHDPPHAKLLAALCRLANTAVVRFSRDASTGGDLLRASERALTGYCHLVHLLLALCASEPAVRGLAALRLRAFRDRPAARHKAAIPDMGELLVLLLAVQGDEGLGWDRMALPVAQEVFARMVRWALRRHPWLAEVRGEEGAAPERMRAMFEEGRVGIRLVLFQVAFAGLVRAGGLDAGALFARLGHPPEELPGKLVAECRAIDRIVEAGSWPEVFARLGIPRHGLRATLPPGVRGEGPFDPAAGRDEVVSRWLRNMVRISAWHGYHGRAGDLWARRREAEAAMAAAAKAATRRSAVDDAPPASSRPLARLAGAAGPGGDDRSVHQGGRFACLDGLDEGGPSEPSGSG